jgi:hypothetical protein
MFLLYKKQVKWVLYGWTAAEYTAIKTDNV